MASKVLFGSPEEQLSDRYRDRGLGSFSVSMWTGRNSYAPADDLITDVVRDRADDLFHGQNLETRFETKEGVK